MNVEELIAREQIRHTLASYHIAGDHDDAEGYAAVFAEDGVLDAGSFRVEGRAAILEWKSTTKAFSAGRGTPPAFRRHHLSTVQIQLTSETEATVKAYWLVITDIGPDHSGYYLDQFVKSGDRWLIRNRRVQTLWRAEQSCTSPNSVSPPPKTL